MQVQRPYVMSIAGHDPSAGAGVTADLKTLEQNGVYGFGVISALTWQNDTAFEAVEWLPVEKIISQAALLLRRFPVTCIKIGLVENVSVLQEIINYLHQHIASPRIILDPVLKASAGFVFHEAEAAAFRGLLPKIYCLTPNAPEAEQIFGREHLPGKLTSYCTHAAIYLKGGHTPGHTVTDILFQKDAVDTFSHPRIPDGEKHGSGCIFSAALTAHIALGKDIKTAAAFANKYTQQVLASNNTKLGYHSNISVS